MHKKITKAKALDIQARQLAEWQAILKPEIYDKLAAQVAEENTQLLRKEESTWDDVFRGQSIDSAVCNLKIKAAYPLTPKK